MKKIIEVLRLHLKLNLSLRQSSTLSKISLGTASNYVNRFKEINIDINEFISAPADLFGHSAGSIRTV